MENVAQNSVSLASPKTHHPTLPATQAGAQVRVWGSFFDHHRVADPGTRAFFRRMVQDVINHLPGRFDVYVVQNLIEFGMCLQPIPFDGGHIADG